MYLYEELEKYCGSDYYPFHMPGHKRRLGKLSEPFSIDITEIEGFDNLHHAEGILLEAQRRAARLYGAEETYFLVNGSTCGILSAIGACVSPGPVLPGKILMARNSHKAAYHAVFLNRLEAVYLYPKRDSRSGQKTEILRENENVREEGTSKENKSMREERTSTENKSMREESARKEKEGAWEHGIGENGLEFWESEINGPILPEDVEACLREHSDIQAVYLTSPTYDGVVSDVERIAAAAHKYDIPLIVDEAHGAHFGMHPIFPRSSAMLGADVVIHSLHKTLPSLTQTALLHVNGDLVDRRKLRKMLGIYQSSSPSYVLMASMDQCIRLLSQKGEELFDVFAEELRRFRAAAGHLQILKLMDTDDPSKILISAGKSGLSGLELNDIFREEYHLEMEMAAGSYVLALTSVGDCAAGFSRLLSALLDLDGKLQVRAKGAGDRSWDRTAHTPVVNEICRTIAEAENSGQKVIPLEESEGCVSGEYIYLYPPGIPLVVPGERIGRELLDQLLWYRSGGYSLQGMEDYRMEFVRILETELQDQ